MESIEPGPVQTPSEHPEKLRLIYAVVLESLLILVVGLAVWGVLWDLSFGKEGLVVAIVIWATVLPALEIATILGYRRRRGGRNVSR